MTILVNHGWRGATFTEAVLDPPYPRTLAVTFDDGFMSVLVWAQPILAKLGLCATVFVPTKFMPRRQPLLWRGVDQWMDTEFAHELEGMCWEDLRTLRGQGWEVGSHTCTHPELTQLDDGGARTELERSRRDVEENLGEACSSLAYPYGNVDERIAALAGSAGYTAAGRLSRGLEDAGPLLWPRVGVYQEDALWRFRLKANTATRRIRAGRWRGTRGPAWEAP